MADSLLVRLTPFALLTAGVLLVSGIREQRVMPAVAPMKSIVVDAPGYGADEMPIDKEEQRIAGMTDFSLRAFRRDSVVGFSTYVGYYDFQTKGKTIHSPRNCLPGAGWETVNFEQRTLPYRGRPVSVNRYVLANGKARALVMYWYQGRGRVESNEYRVKWNLLQDAARYGRTEEALVRIVVPLSPDLTQAGEASWSSSIAVADSTALAVGRQLLVQVDRVMPSSPDR